VDVTDPAHPQYLARSSRLWNDTGKRRNADDARFGAVANTTGWL